MVGGAVFKVHLNAVLSMMTRGAWAGGRASWQATSQTSLRSSNGGKESQYHLHLFTTFGSFGEGTHELIKEMTNETDWSCSDPWANQT